MAEIAELSDNGIPPSSVNYFDSDYEDNSGPKPSELYGQYTWKIENFSQINNRELQSTAFEVGGYKWKISFYPQGCDVLNHLSSFLSVANHETLVPGWSHVAQFSIAVVNKDPKKSKYSDTIHRFCKKEHDWGWKKFIEMPLLLNGFIISDSITIKAQVQVIRVKEDQLFRCIGCKYRRELIRVYMTNVEHVIRRFVEERKSEFGKLIEDRTAWSSFRDFWSGVDQNSRRRLSSEKTSSIFKEVVRRFFNEKEVTSTMVMDSLHSGLKALEAEEITTPIVRVEKDAFVLTDDAILLVERISSEPFPPKFERNLLDRIGNMSLSNKFNGEDSNVRDERKLTEFGRYVLELFALSHIFSTKIEAAYKEAVALKLQEELIREEEEEKTK